MKFSLKNIFFIIIGCLLGIFFTRLFIKTPTADDEIFVSHTFIVNKIESMGNLEVAKYNVQDIIEYKKMRQWLPNAKAAVQVSGEIIVCIDLTKISEENVTITGDSVVLLLPPPEICHVKIDHSQSKVFDTTYGFWESATLVDEAYKHAQKELEIQANRLDLTKEARENTENIIRPMLNALGFKHVAIFYDDRDVFVN